MRKIGRGMPWNSNRGDFTSLTDLARPKDNAPTIHHAKLNRNTTEFPVLGIPFTTRNITVSNRRQAGLNSFVMTPQKWGRQPALSASSPRSVDTAALML